MWSSIEKNRPHPLSILILYRSPVCSKIDQQAKHNISAKRRMMLTRKQKRPMDEYRQRGMMWPLRNQLWLTTLYSTEVWRVPRYAVLGYSDFIYVDYLWDTSVNPSIAL